MWSYYYKGKTKGTQDEEPRKEKLRSSKAIQAEAHVDVVGLAAAATDEGPKVLVATRRLREVNDLS